MERTGEGCSGSGGLTTGENLMNPMEAERAQKLVARLERAGENHGLLVIQGYVVIRDGVNCEDTPADFEEADLLNAVALNLLQENQVSGSVEWKWYVLKARVYTTRVWSRSAPERVYTIFTSADFKEQANIKAQEVIRIHPIPNMDGVLEYETLNTSRPLKPGENFNFAINNPDGSELAVG